MESHCFHDEIGEAEPSAFLEICATASLGHALKRRDHASSKVNGKDLRLPSITSNLRSLAVPTQKYIVHYVYI